MLRICLFFIIVFSFGAVYAQDGLNRSVNVSKEYAPLVERARKLPVAPHMDDTTTLKPDFEYVVRPRAWSSRFDVAPIKAAQIAIDAPESPTPFYAKLGGGAPGQTLADIYFASRHAGVYANHRGQWGDILNVAARTTTNSAGLFGRARAGNWSVRGEFAVDDKSYSDYLLAGRKLHYTTPEAAFVLGNDFFSIDAKGWLLAPHKAIWGDERGIKANALFKRHFGVHFMKLSAGVNYWQAVGALGLFVNVAPEYELHNEHFKFAMGGKFGFEPGHGNICFIPKLELRMNGAVSPYVRIAGRLYSHSYRSLIAINPYLDPQFKLGSAPDMTVEHMLHAGISGRIGYVMAWNIYAGGEMHRNMLLESCATPYFIGTVDALAIGGELEAKAGGFSASLNAKYLNHNQLSAYMPEFKGSISAGYSCKKWAVSAFAESHGGYRFFNTTVEAPAATDLALEAEYKLSKRLWIFASGGNLLGQKLYPYALHRGIGRSVSAGVKLVL